MSVIDDKLTLKSDFTRITSQLKSNKIQAFRKIDDLKELKASLDGLYLLALLNTGKVWVFKVDSHEVFAEIDFGSFGKSFLMAGNDLLVFGKGIKVCRDYLKSKNVELLDKDDVSEACAFENHLFLVNGQKLKRISLDGTRKNKDLASKANHIAVNSRLLITAHKKEIFIYDHDLVFKSTLMMKDDYLKYLLFENDVLVAGAGRKSLEIYDYSKKKMHDYKKASNKTIFSFAISEEMRLLVTLDKDLSFFNIDSFKDEARLITDNEVKKNLNFNKSIFFAQQGKLLFFSVGVNIYKIEIVEKYLLPKVSHFSSHILNLQLHGDVFLNTEEELIRLTETSSEKILNQHELCTSRGLFSYNGNILTQDGRDLTNVVHSSQIRDVTFVKGCIVSVDIDNNMNVLDPEGNIFSFSWNSYAEFLGIVQGYFFFMYSVTKDRPASQVPHRRVESDINLMEISGMKQDSSVSNQLAQQMIEIRGGPEGLSTVSSRNIEGVVLMFNKSPCLVSFNDWTLQVYEDVLSESSIKVKCSEIIGQVKFCSVSDDDLFFYAATDSSLSVWSLFDYKYLGSIDYGCIENIVITNKSVFISNKNQLQVYQNPFNPDSELSLLIPEKFSLKYWIGLSQLVHRSGAEGNIFYEKYLNSSVILPISYNLLHFFAHNSNETLLKKALKEGCSFIRSTRKISPINVILEQKTNSLVDIFFKAIPRLLEYDPTALYRVEDDLVELNKRSSSRLILLYESLLLPADQTLPKFGAPLASGNNVKLSDSRIINRDDFVKPTSTDLNNLTFRDKVPVSFQVSGLRLPLKFGTQASLNFLESLVKCSQSEILTTPIIQSILTSKWAKIWYWTFMQCLILAAVLVLLCVYIFWLESQGVTFYLIQILNLINFGLECLQMSVGFKKYIKNFLNILDFLRICCIFFLWFEFDSSYEKILLTYIVMLCWAKLLFYLRIFNETRYFIYIVKSCARDIIPFLVILFYLNFAFAVCFYNLDFLKKSPSFNSFIDAWVHSYVMNFNSFSINVYQDVKDWMVFIVATVINPLILMNMIIALLGNTYSMVKENAGIADKRELAEMIIEFESMLFWRRDLVKKQFVQICSSIRNNDSENDDIKTTVKQIANNFVATKAMLESCNNQSDNMTYNIELLLNKVSNEFSKDLEDFEKSYAEDYKKVIERFFN